MMAGRAALAMWWNMAAEWRAEFEHWHSHEHFAERLALPGFLRATRWADARGGEGFFVLYELADWDALASPEYLARLNAPTEWSRRMMPHHRQMVRSPCRVQASHGAAVAGHALTLRLSAAEQDGAALESAAQDGAAQRLRAHLDATLAALPQQPGLAGAHLLHTDAPALAPTTEQQIRGLADRAADGIVLVTGYDADALAALVAGGGALSAARLQAAGAAAGIETGHYRLRLSMLAGDTR